MNEVKVIRNRPVGLFITAILLLLLALFMTSLGGQNIIIAVILLIPIILIILLMPVQTYTVDPTGGRLIIQSKSILKKSHKEIPIADIKTIEIDTSTHRDGSDRSTNYRLVARMKDDTIIPFQSYFSGGLLKINKQCSQLREWMHLNDPEQTQGLVRNLVGSEMDAVQEKFIAQQEAVTGEQDEVYVTGDVHWKMETKTVGTIPMSRWHSKDFTLDGDFFFIVQKLAGQKDMPAVGFLSGLATTMFQQSMNIYGFTDFHAPGRNGGRNMDNYDNRLKAHFSIYGSNENLVERVANPWVVNTLLNWAEKYPLKQGTDNQLAILVGSQGVYLAKLKLVDQQILSDMTDLGVELVKSLKAGV